MNDQCLHSGPEPGLWAFLGNYGSGKTEIAVNYAIAGAEHDIAPVSLIDLDIINPYFRSREAEDILNSFGIRLISPKGELKNADLPIVTPEVKSMINDHKGLLVLDIGGEDTGANVIKPYTPSLNKDSSNICMVINMRRPFTSNTEGILETKKRIEDKTGIKIKYFINNTNLIDQTELNIITESHRIIKELSDREGIKFLWTAILKEYAPLIKGSIHNSEIFTLQRIMMPPWYSNIEKYSPLRDRRSFIK